MGHFLGARFSAANWCELDGTWLVPGYVHGAG